MRHMLILGGGTAGTIMANKLASALDERDWRITVVDGTEEHYYQPGFLFVPFGIYRMRDIVRRRRQYLPGRARLIPSSIDHIDPQKKSVTLFGGEGPLRFARSASRGRDYCGVFEGCRRTQCCRVRF